MNKGLVYWNFFWCSGVLPCEGTCSEYFYPNKKGGLSDYAFSKAPFRAHLHCIAGLEGIGL